VAVDGFVIRQYFEPDSRCDGLSFRVDRLLIQHVDVNWTMRVYILGRMFLGSTRIPEQAQKDGRHRYPETKISRLTTM
jgi:hypothetical protein